MPDNNNDKTKTSLYPCMIAVRALVKAESTADARKVAFDNMTTLLQAGLLSYEQFEAQTPLRMQDFRVLRVENLGTPEDAPLRKQL